MQSQARKDLVQVYKHETWHASRSARWGSQQSPQCSIWVELREYIESLAGLLGKNTGLVNRVTGMRDRHTWR